MKIKRFECLPKSIRNYEKKFLGRSDAWSTSRLSQRTSEPAYYIVDFRISIDHKILIKQALVSGLTVATDTSRAASSPISARRQSFIVLENLMNDQVNENMNAPSEICLPHCEFLFAYGI